MSTITLELHAGRECVRSVVDLDRLTPRARALAQAWHSRRIPGVGPVVIESTRTRREIDPDVSPIWHTDAELDAPDRVVWCSWSHYPDCSAMDPHEYIERQAHRLPVGYVVVSAHRGDRVPSVQDAMRDAHLITKAQLVGVLRDAGRPVTAAALDNYRSAKRAPAGWPQPAVYLERTPLWDLAEVEAYLRGETTGAGGGTPRPSTTTTTVEE